ncbi:flagellar hook-length control protein FliK [bacterium]|nr:MAG: flagellar hook-length control protein FliK [bacterium]
MSGLDGLIRALLPPAPLPGAAGPPLDAAQLRTLLDVGNVLSVKVLAGILGRPLIEIAGRPVLAALPEGIAPGDLLQVRVEGFTPDQVLLKLLVRTAGPPAGEPVVSAPATPSDDGWLAPATPAQPVVLQRTAAAQPDGTAAVVEANDLRARLAAFRLSTASGTLPPPRRTAPPLPASLPPDMPAVQAPSTPAPVLGERAATGAAILRTLRIPVTPTTLAAARIALEGSTRVAAALDTLQRALPDGSEDPRVRQLRAIAEFVGTLDPTKPDVLPARIEAYVDHVLSQEARLRHVLLPAQRQAAEAPAPVPNSAAPNSPAQSAGQASLEQGNTAPPEAAPIVPPEIAEARMAVARETVAANLKTHVMSLLNDGPADLATRAALQGALTAVTAAQIQMLSLQTAAPQALVVPLPLPFPSGGQQAYLRVARDARRPGEPLNAESFRLALVLETSRHGTVAIDLLCADRALSVDVKAERESAAAAFERGLPDLASRLERLAYRVVRLGAGVAPVRSASSPVSAERSPDRPARGLDLQA